MTDTPDADLLFDATVQERGGSASFSITQLVIARRRAQALASDAGDLRDIVALEALLPPIVPRSAREVTLEELDASPVDLSLLDDADLDTLERLLSIARGASVPLPDKRRSIALNLAALLNGSRSSDALPECSAGQVDAAVHLHIHDLLRGTGLLPGDVFRCYTTPDEAEILALKAEVAELRRDLHLARSRSGKVVSLAQERAKLAEAEAPIMHQGSSMERLSAMVSPVRPGSIGDHPGHIS